MAVSGNSTNSKSASTGELRQRSDSAADPRRKPLTTELRRLGYANAKEKCSHSRYRREFKADALPVETGVISNDTLAN